jgi:hypothetical protein
MSLPSDPDSPLSTGRTPHPRIVRLVDYWRGLAPGLGLLPARRHFDPMRVPELLPNLWLVDVVRGPPRRYRYRLVGNALIDAGAPIRPGLFIDEMDDRIDQQAAHAAFDGVVDTHRPDWRRGPPIIQHLKFISELERVLLPLAEDGQTVDVVLGMTVFYLLDGAIR